MGLKVAIVGLAQSSRHLAPWDNPEWELWGLAWDAERYRFHRVFEMHDMADLGRVYKPLEPYLEKISHCARLYMAEKYAEVPVSERFPFEQVAEVCGDYWESSIGYALSLAITEGAEEIGLYGVNMKASEEYAYQRPNVEYLLGLAKGRGIKTNVPDNSPILKFSGFDGYAGRYGRTP